MKGNATAAPIVADELFHVEDSKPSVYLYPITSYTFKKGSNDYILRVKELLSKDFTVMNEVTGLGMFDILFKLPKCNVIFLNWIEDLPDKRFGYLQTVVLLLILVLSKAFGIRIAWLVHNDGSHFRKNHLAKKFIQKMMMFFADVSFSHSHELSIAGKLTNHKVYEHPVDAMKDAITDKPMDIDALVWGSVSPYKGVADLIRFNHNNGLLNDHKIVVAGKFSSEEFYNEVIRYSKKNIKIINRVQTEEELEDLFSRSRYILFCYRSPSVLGSAALCKSLSYGKTVIGPAIGAFKEMGAKGLIYTYDTFDELAILLNHLKTSNAQKDPQILRDYISATSWEGFGDFLAEHLHPETAEMLSTGVMNS